MCAGWLAAQVHFAGCCTGDANEGGYDHTLYRYRLAPENYAYSVGMVHK
jgi:hypothetical protein